VAWLDAHFPNRRTRIEGRIRQCRDGRLSDARFGRRMRGEGTYAEHVAALFSTAARRFGLAAPLPPLTTDGFRRPRADGEQLSLC
jgi:hypothetical protein